jgi:hypothetical protein
MRLLRVPLLAACAFALSASHASAATIFTASITTDQESVPINPTLTTGGPRPIAFGTATFTLNDAQTALSFTATIFNIDVTGAQTSDTNDNLTAAHIHGGGSFPPANNPVVWGFFGSPFNNNNPNDGVLTPFASGVGGTFTGTWDVGEGQNTTLTAQLPNLFAGRTYINFHTTQFGGGEIRGAILNSVPDGGASAALLGFACVGLLALRRKTTRR